MYYVYVLKSSADGSYYVGQTSNLEDRLKRHNESRSIYTKSRRPWKLVYFEKYDTRSLAIKRERQIKAWKKRDYVTKLIERPD